MPHRRNPKVHKKAASAQQPSGRRNSSDPNWVMWAGTTVPPVIRSVENRVFSFCQDLAPTYPLIGQTATTESDGGFNFTLQQLDQYAQLIYVFDQYRFDAIEVTFRPQFTSNGMEAGTNIVVPLLYTVVDYDDSNAIPITTLRQYDDCAQSLYETQVRRFTPHCATAMYQGSFAGYGNVASPWIDCSSSTVQHYGVKFGITAGNTGQTVLQNWAVTVRAKVSFKNLH
jgi:hypothetical protein